MATKAQIKKAQAAREAHHAEKGVDTSTLKPWDELTEEKQQRWLDEVA